MPSFMLSSLLLVLSPTQLPAATIPQTAQCALPSPPEPVPTSGTAPDPIPLSAAHPETDPWSTPGSTRSCPRPDPAVTLPALLQSSQSHAIRKDPPPLETRSEEH